MGVFEDFKIKKIELTQINKPKGRDPKMWSTDVLIEAFEEYLEDEIYSLPTKAVEKDFLNEVKRVEEAINEPFSETLKRLKKLNRFELTSNQSDETWSRERKKCFTSTKPMLTETGRLADSFYEVKAYRIANAFLQSGDIELHDMILDSMDMSATKAMGVGTFQEDIMRERLSELLAEEIDENGLVVLEDSLLGDSIDGAIHESTKELTVNGIKIPKGSKIGFEIKNPKFSNYLNPNYMDKYKIQNQWHLLVSGFDVIITAKCFHEFDMELDVIFPDENYFRLILEQSDEYSEQLIDDVNTFVDKYSIGF